ncbi:MULTISPECIES: hypothetical protein [unclassified Streptomyces]|uniref:hypothetical protein n=1 Tax=unclassified Streptomyces TaxID=2593676 RepID=UPI002366A5DE|nr:MULTISPECIES: hypothetical protein [unclassified Streptomyces]MDF3145711.1 hypothetical protein [Streptomyces sp. T21Q-yed]WDF42354.1 hypothetical protein PBV52_38950 [Streptomyces sp. T12]
MTADPITAADRLAGEVMRTRPADPVFARRLGQRLHTWDVEQVTFLAQVESVVLAALLATADESAAGLPGTWCPAAAAVLRRQQDMQMFAALPASLPDPVKVRMDQLRLLSTGLTPGSGHRWLRLCDTACEFLEPAPLLEEGGEPPAPRG